MGYERACTTDTAAAGAMSGEEAVAYLKSRASLGSKLGLSRIRELLAALGNPQKTLRFVHVAGTNGKGSTSAMLASILAAAGYRVGLFTSPCLERINEQITVNGEPISDEALGAGMGALKQAAEAMADPPSEFEVLTALAFLHFVQCGCDLVVLEVGMGGATDSTNVIDPPEAAVITAISLDHTAVLGHSLTEIAAVKAGIIKSGCDVVLYPNPSVERIIAEICDRQGARLHPVELARATALKHGLEGQTFQWDGEELFLPLLGGHQLNNAAAALTTIEILRTRGWSVSPEAVRLGLRRTRWPARFEVLIREPLFLLDGGHNPQGAAALADNIAEYLPGRTLTFLVGLLADKDYEAMLRRVEPFASAFVAVSPNNSRALPVEALAEHLAGFGKPVTICGSVEQGVEAARMLAEEGGAVCAFGSLYMAGAVRRCVLGEKALREESSNGRI
ncbi:MAG: FolC bifunctional protein [Oscillospiraceae bacterium]|nr:FolC bifunctional protein [Oscillospiraceae bacterium]